LIRAKIVGACGCGGVGITELLHHHPQAEPAVFVDVENVGKPIAMLYPHLDGFVDGVIVAPDSPEAAQDADVVFMATLDGVGMKLAQAEVDVVLTVYRDFFADDKFVRVLGSTAAVGSMQVRASEHERALWHAGNDRLGRAG
jgi:N-acetyl-gamma-glutamylphosphate reductase